MNPFLAASRKPTPKTLDHCRIRITEEMLEHARDIQHDVVVLRTQASNIDTLTGLIGEFCFAEWWLGDWSDHDAMNTAGRADFGDDIEIKASTFPYSENLNLLVRRDYARKRKPLAYVQCIIDAPSKHETTIKPGWVCHLTGWASSGDVDEAPLRDFGSKGGGIGGYKCHYIPITKLNCMDLLPDTVGE